MNKNVNQEKQEGINYLNEESDRICETYKKIAEKLTQNFETNLHLLKMPMNVVQFLNNF